MVAGAGQGPSEKSSFILFFVVAFHLTTLWRARSSFWRGRAGAVRKVIFYAVFVVTFHLTTLFDDFVAARSSFWRGLAGAIRKVIFYVVLFWQHGGPE